METGENRPKYRLVAVRDSGERIVISTHVSPQSANVALNLIRNCAGFSEVRIEGGQRRGRRPARQAARQA